MPEAEFKGSPSANHQLERHESGDGVENTGYRPSVSEPLPIKYTSRQRRMTDESGDAGDGEDNDQRIYGRSSSFRFNLSTFSEWGTESTTTDEDPFIYDDDTSWVKSSYKSVSTTDVGKMGNATADSRVAYPLPVMTAEVVGMVCIDENHVVCESGAVVGGKQILAKWLGAVWRVVMRIFQRRVKREVSGEHWKSR